MSPKHTSTTSTISPAVSITSSSPWLITTPDDAERPRPGTRKPVFCVAGPNFDAPESETTSRASPFVRWLLFPMLTTSNIFFNKSQTRGVLLLQSVPALVARICRDLGICRHRATSGKYHIRARYIEVTQDKSTIPRRIILAPSLAMHTIDYGKHGDLLAPSIGQENQGDNIFFLQSPRTRVAQKSQPSRAVASTAAAVSVFFFVAERKMMVHRERRESHMLVIWPSLVERSFHHPSSYPLTAALTDVFSGLDPRAVPKLSGGALSRPPLGLSTTNSLFSTCMLYRLVAAGEQPSKFWEHHQLSRAWKNPVPLIFQLDLHLEE